MALRARTLGPWAPSAWCSSATVAEKAESVAPDLDLEEPTQRIIELRFGPLGPDALTRRDAADEAALVRFAERGLTATTVEDVLGR
jgi:hypothetical protein